MGIEQEPRFEKPVPWDESIIPPLRREYLRKLHEDPKEAERFWSDEKLEKNLREKTFQEMIVVGFTAADGELNHPVLRESDNDEEFNNRFRDFQQKVENLTASAEPEKETPFEQPEIFRQWFALTMKFMIEEGGAKKEMFEIAPFIARAYELEADYYRHNGIDPTEIYPFVEEKDVVMGRRAKEKEQTKGADASADKEVKSRGISSEELPEDEKALAEKGEKYLKEQAWHGLRRQLLRLSEPGSKERRKAHEDFERAYQKIKEDKKKEIN
ncbi:MAG: hypothetical protein HYY55_02760 [Candidatus Niyogibacteria bacterium]|nr:MAG: hypothetical protein HYY55_02760 [Candidatus Niyogibacteria bacterium]